MEKDPEYGFENMYADYLRPAGLVMDAEQQYFSDVVDWIPGYELRDGKLFIDDPVWGRETIGNQPEDGVLIELATHDALRRLQAVEQLTLPRDYTTIPNTSLFSRWEHIWGSVVLTRRLARQHQLPPDESIKLQLRTLLSDVGHTTGSHLGDWLFQGMGSDEDQHDSELASYLEKSGVNKIIRSHNIDPADVVFPEVEDWIECPAPGLCIDRVDYGLREVRRWVPTDLIARQIYREDGDIDFVIEDEMLVMTDRHKAKAFAEAFLELSREHWNDPVHRLQLKLYMARAKRVITNEHGFGDGWLDYHPRDILYCSDPEYLLAMNEHDVYGHTLDVIMRDVAKYERRIGWWRRKSRVEHRLRVSDDFGDSNGIYDEYAPYHPMLSIEPPEKIDAPDTAGLTFKLPGLKIRQLDPIIKTRSQIKRLSELDKDFKNRLEHHKAEMGKPYIAKIAIADEQLAAYLRKETENVDQKWQEMMSRPRMDERTLSYHIGSAALWAGPHGFINYRTD